MSSWSAWLTGKSGEVEGEEGAAQKDEWIPGLGNFVRNVGGYASSIGETVKTTMQEKTFMGEFEAEQKKFEEEHRRQKDAAVPPWVGYHEEEHMKAQILQLSADSRNVLRNPPPGVQFNFNFSKSYPVAMALLKEDPNLQKLRFELVPKKISEENFWQNYFYRVFLIKQSSQLATLSAAEKEAADGQSEDVQDSQGAGEVAVEGGDDEDKTLDTFPTDTEIQSPGAEEFASDALHPAAGEEISRESVKAELGQLGVASSPTKTDQWEADLQAELQELDIQGLDEGGGAREGVEDEAWEAELEQMLDMHSDD